MVFWSYERDPTNVLLPSQRAQTCCCVFNPNWIDNTEKLNDSAKRQFVTFAYVLAAACSHNQAIIYSCFHCCSIFFFTQTHADLFRKIRHTLTPNKQQRTLHSQQTMITLLGIKMATRKSTSNICKMCFFFKFC